MSCKENNIDPPIVDPCQGKEQVKAKFEIYEAQAYNSDIWKYTDTDTIMRAAAFFKAIGEFEEYEWHLGSEIIKEKSFVRYNLPRGVHIPITLIVRKKPETACFPNDDGIDTITRSFYSMAEGGFKCWEKELFSGNFLGSEVGIDTSRVITIDVCFSPDNYSIAPKIINLIYSQELVCWPEMVQMDYKHYYLEDYAGKYNALKAMITIFGSANDSIKIEYKYLDPVEWEKGKYVWIPKTFIGRRVE